MVAGSGEDEAWRPVVPVPFVGSAPFSVLPMIPRIGGAGQPQAANLDVLHSQFSSVENRTPQGRAPTASAGSEGRMSRHPTSQTGGEPNMAAQLPHRESLTDSPHDGGWRVQRKCSANGLLTAH